MPTTTNAKQSKLEVKIGESVIFADPGACDGLRRRVYLGTDRYGNRYWNDLADLYVYQMLASGHWNGWFCALSSWESTMHRVLRTA